MAATRRDPARPGPSRRRRASPRGLSSAADPLTGLASRRALEEVISRLGGSWTAGPGRGAAAPTSDPRPPAGACLIVDVVGLKQANAAGGYSAGDRVVTEAAARLRTIAPSARLLARLGGDEFVAVFTGPAAGAAAALACRLAGEGTPRLRAAWGTILPGEGAAALFDRLHEACRRPG